MLYPDLLGFMFFNSVLHGSMFQGTPRVGVSGTRRAHALQALGSARGLDFRPVGG
jgi:hypothetical protein